MSCLVRPELQELGDDGLWSGALQLNANICNKIEALSKRMSTPRDRNDYRSAVTERYQLVEYKIMCKYFSFAYSVLHNNAHSNCNMSKYQIWLLCAVHYSIFTSNNNLYLGVKSSIFACSGLCRYLSCCNSSSNNSMHYTK